MFYLEALAAVSIMNPSASSSSSSLFLLSIPFYLWNGLYLIQLFRAWRSYFLLLRYYLPISFSLSLVLPGPNHSASLLFKRKASLQVSCWLGCSLCWLRTDTIYLTQVACCSFRLIPSASSIIY